jgi:hypothetical protein
MWQDLRFGLELLWKEKGFTLTALATLALCIGGNAAIFTVLHAVILAPLPFPEPECWSQSATSTPARASQSPRTSRFRTTWTDGR